MRMLSTCFFKRHCSGDASGSCRVPGCKPNTPGTLEHLATGQCKGLSPSTNSAIPHHWITFSSSHPPPPPYQSLLGKLSPSKTDEFSEKFQMAFDPPPPPHFRKVMLQIFSEIHDRSIVYNGKNLQHKFLD